MADTKDLNEPSKNSREAKTSSKDFQTSVYQIEASGFNLKDKQRKQLSLHKQSPRKDLPRLKSMREMFNTSKYKVRHLKRNRDLAIKYKRNNSLKAFLKEDSEDDQELDCIKASYQLRKNLFNYSLKNFKTGRDKGRTDHVLMTNPAKLSNENSFLMKKLKEKMIEINGLNKEIDEKNDHIKGLVQDYSQLKESYDSVLKLKSHLIANSVKEKEAASTGRVTHRVKHSHSQIPDSELEGFLQKIEDLQRENQELTDKLKQAKDVSKGWKKKYLECKEIIARRTFESRFSSTVRSRLTRKQENKIKTEKGSPRQTRSQLKFAMTFNKAKLKKELKSAPRTREGFQKKVVHFMPKNFRTTRKQPTELKRFTKKTTIQSSSLDYYKRGSGSNDFQNRTHTLQYLDENENLAGIKNKDNNEKSFEIINIMDRRGRPDSSRGIAPLKLNRVSNQGSPRPTKNVKKDSNISGKLQSIFYAMMNKIPTNCPSSSGRRAASRLRSKDSSILSIMTEVAKSLSVLLQTEPVEIVVTDAGVVHLFNEFLKNSGVNTVHYDEKYITLSSNSLADRDPLAPRLPANLEASKSIGLVTLYKELPELLLSKNILFRNTSIYVPILTTWRQTSPKTIGVIIISNPRRSGQDPGGNSAKKETNGFGSPWSQRLSKMASNRHLRSVIDSSERFGSGAKNGHLISSSVLNQIQRSLSHLFDMILLDLKLKKSQKKFHAISDLVSVFRFDDDIVETLVQIRSQLPGLLDYEDMSVLLKSTQSSSAYYTVSPHTSCRQLCSDDKNCDLFFYQIKENSITEKALNSQEMVVKKDPRVDNRFTEGLDNLTPVVALREIVYLPLRPRTLKSDQEIIGVIQLVNKINGEVDDNEKELLGNLSPIIATYLSMIITNIDKTSSIKRFHKSFKHVKELLEDSDFEIEYLFDTTKAMKMNIGHH